MAALPEISAVASPRLTLRPVAARDLPDLLEMNGDPQVTRFLPYPTWQSLDDGHAWLARMEALVAAGTGRQLVLARNADGKILGSLLLFKYDEGSRRVELGYALGRAHWGGGYMREAVQAACAHAFTALGLRRIEAEVNPDNAASNALLLRVGFTREGTLRRRWVAKGVAYDTHVYGYLAEDRRREVRAPAPVLACPPLAEGDTAMPAERQLIGSGSSFESEIGYSRAVSQGDWVFVSGTTGFDYASMTIAEGVVAQAEQCLKNIESALAQAGASLADVVRVTYVLPDGADFPACWPVLRKYFGEVRPAAMMISAGLADPRMRIEIEVTALKRSR